MEILLALGCSTKKAAHDLEGEAQKRGFSSGVAGSKVLANLTVISYVMPVKA